jgi:peptide/nickel transport system substrate-binding protein
MAAACADGARNADTTPGTTPNAAENQVNPVARENLREGGKFTFALTQMPSNFNYNQLDGTLRDNYFVIAALIPTTFTTDAAGTPVWNRDLLESEPTIVTDPKQVITYRIHPKAGWYDGTPITWEDFFWQWKASNGIDKRYQISAANGFDQIESVVRGKDDREVIVTLASKFADWPSLFNYLYPISTNKDPRVFNEGWVNAPLTTAGPFRLGAVDRTSQTITLVRNEKWWGRPALLDTIVFRVISPDAQIDAMANGEIDAMDIGPDANKYSRAKGIADADIRVAGGPNFRHITFNGTSANLQDVTVRRALAMAIDRNTIARAMLAPLGMNAKSLDNHIFMSNQAGYRDNSGDVGSFNPQRAATLLDSAGWKLDGPVRKKDGKPLEISFVIPAGVATAKQESELVQSMLGQIGVTVQIRSVPMNDAFARYVTPGEYGLTVFSWIGTAYPMSSAKSVYAKPTRRPDGSLDVQQNYARIGSDLIDSLFIAANGELDRAKALELGNRIDSLIWDEVHSLTTYQRPELILVKKRLANFGAFGFAIPWVYEDIGWMK